MGISLRNGKPLCFSCSRILDITIPIVHQINKSFLKAPSHQNRFSCAFVCSSESFSLRRTGLSLESDAG